LSEAIEEGGNDTYIEVLGVDFTMLGEVEVFLRNKYTL